MAAAERRKPSVVVVDGGVQVALWRADHLDRPTLEVVEALARLQLQARRLGCEIKVRDACVELRGLLDLVGLADTVLDAPSTPGPSSLGPSAPGPPAPGPFAPGPSAPGGPQPTDEAGA